MNNTLITKDRLDELLRLCKKTPYGAIAEVGVYKGGSLKLLAQSFPDRRVVGFDTFDGLPSSHWEESEVHKPGDFSDNSIEQVEEFLKPCDNVMLVQGIFPSSADWYVANDLLGLFSFVHIDTDFYQSVKDCITWFYPRMRSGGIMVFDDYKWPNCPGVKKALDESGLEYKPTKAKYQAYIKIK